MMEIVVDMLATGASSGSVISILLDPIPLPSLVPKEAKRLRSGFESVSPNSKHNSRSRLEQGVSLDSDTLWCWFGFGLQDNGVLSMRFFQILIYYSKISKGFSQG